MSLDQATIEKLKGVLSKRVPNDRDEMKFLLEDLLYHPPEEVAEVFKQLTDAEREELYEQHLAPFIRSLYKGDTGKGYAYTDGPEEDLDGPIYT